MPMCSDPMASPPTDESLNRSGGAAKKSKDSYGHGAFAATEAMIGVAQAGGNPDDLIAIRGRDRRTPDDYLDLSQMGTGKGQPRPVVAAVRRGGRPGIVDTALVKEDLDQRGRRRPFEERV